MTFEGTFKASDVETALATIADTSASSNAAQQAIRSILASGALGEDRLIHAHATTSERMVAVLVRVVEHPEDAR
jgi:hypothetical protein